MPPFSKGVSRLPVVLAALAACCLVPPETLALGPNLCLWRHLFHLSACPACGSIRALTTFFHGQFSRALSFNPNVVITAPGVLVLVVADLGRLLRKAPASILSNLRSWKGLNRVRKVE